MKASIKIVLTVLLSYAEEASQRGFATAKDLGFFKKNYSNWDADFGPF